MLPEGTSVLRTALFEICHEQAGQHWKVYFPTPEITIQTGDNQKIIIQPGQLEAFTQWLVSLLPVIRAEREQRAAYVGERRGPPTP